MIVIVRWNSKNKNYFYRLKLKKWLMSLKINNPKFNKSKFKITNFNNRKTILRGILTFKIKINFISMKPD